MPGSVHAHTNLPHLGLDASKRTYISRRLVWFSSHQRSLIKGKPLTQI